MVFVSVLLHPFKLTFEEKVMYYGYTIIVTFVLVVKTRAHNNHVDWLASKLSCLTTAFFSLLVENGLP